MGILWEHTQNETTYSVRSAGGSIRLYSNRVFHSQWNPKRPFAGAVWDCLTLPVLYKKPESIKRILLLGLGGGASVRQLQTLLSFDKLVSVEIDPVHIDIAQRWFDVTDNNIDLIEADAIAWLKAYKGPKFDYVIDDLFGHSDNEAMRAQPLNASWITELERVMSQDALLVVNCIDRSELMRSTATFKSAGFKQGYRWSQLEYENAIGVLFRQPVRTSEWSTNLDASNLSADMQRVARAVVRRPWSFG